MKKLSLLSLIFIHVAFGCTSYSYHSFDYGISGAKFYQSAGKSWSITHEEEIVRAGSGSVRFELRPDDTWHDTFKNSHRTEMRFNNSGSGWYGFSMYIPDNGSIIGSKTYIGQWHYAGVGSPLRGTSKAPPISQVFVGSAQDMLAIKVHHDKGVEYLLMENFKRGQWHDMVYYIKFSSNDSGILNVWWNGKQVVNYKGPTMYRGSVTFFKFGIYTMRANEMPADNKLVVYFDEYSVGSSYEDVDPSKGSNIRADL